MPAPFSPMIAVREPRSSVSSGVEASSTGAPSTVTPTVRSRALATTLGVLAVALLATRMLCGSGGGASTSSSRLSLVSRPRASFERWPAGSG